MKLLIADDEARLPVLFRKLCAPFADKIRQCTGGFRAFRSATLLLVLGCLTLPATLRAQDAAGRSLVMDGTTASARANVPNPASGSFTVEFWMKRRSGAVPGGLSPGVAKLSGDSWRWVNPGDWALGLDAAGLPVFSLHAVSTWLDTYPFNIPVGQWVHLAGVYDALGQEVILYVNGVAWARAPINRPDGSPFVEVSRPQGANEAPVTLGSAAGYFLDGSLDEVRIWSVVRTPTQILGTRNTPLAGNEAGLEAYWRMDEATGTVLLDSSGKGRNAQLLGSVIREESQAGLSTAPVSVSLPGRGGRQAKARATIGGSRGWIQQADLTDAGEGYGSRRVGVIGRGSSGISWVGSYYPFDPSIYTFSLEAWTDDTVLVIEPPRSNDLALAFDNPRVNEIRLATGTYFHNAIVDRDLVIRGEGAGRTIVSGALLDSVFKVRPGVTLILEDLSVIDGLAPSGGGIYNEGTLVLNRVEVSGCRAYAQAGGEGGGVYNRGSARLTVRDCVFRDNAAARNGGAISSSGFNLSRFRTKEGTLASAEITAHNGEVLSISAPAGPADEAGAEAAEGQYDQAASARATRTGSAEQFVTEQVPNPLENVLGWLGLGSPVAQVTNTVFQNNKVGYGIASSRFLQEVQVGARVYLVEIPQPRFLVFGAGIHNDLGLLRVDHCTFLENEAASTTGSSGGAISSTFGALEVRSSQLNSNRVDASGILAMGGAIHSFGSFVRIRDTDMSDNTVSALFLSSGGALKNTFGSFTSVEDSRLERNHSGGGGAIANDYYALLSVEESALRDNRVAGIISAHGGGLRNDDGGQATVSGSLVSGNQAKGKAKGGGIYNGCEGSDVILATTLQLRNSTVSLNEVDGQGTYDLPFAAFGAGIYNGSFNLGFASVLVRSCTIVSNRAYNGLFQQGGGLYSTALSTLKASTTGNRPGISAVDLQNTLLGHNQPEDCFNRIVSGSTVILSSGYNMDSDGSAAWETELSELTLPSEARFRTVDAVRVGPLRFNGGSTATHALLPDSPAKNAGGLGNTALEPWRGLDQRGVPRLFGGAKADIGAYESTPPLVFAETREALEDTLLVVPPREGVLADDFVDQPIAATAIPPAHGRIALAEDGGFLYQPDTNYTGPDRFRYVVTDVAGRQAVADVDLFVRPALDWIDMSPADQTEAERYTDVVLTFDAPVTIEAVQGGVSVVGSRSGTHSFEATVDAATATLRINTDFLQGEVVTVTVLRTMRGADGSPFAADEFRQFRIFPNRPPVPPAPRSFAVDKNRGLQVRLAQSLLNGATDPDGDNVFVREDVWVRGSLLELSDRFSLSPDRLQYLGEYPNGSWAFRTPVFAERGQLTLRGDGTFTYRPPTNFLGRDTFSFVVTDGLLESAPVTVEILVTGEPNPPEPRSDEYGVLAFDPSTARYRLSVPAPGVLENDVSNSTLALRAELVTPPSAGTVTFHPDGGFEYASNPSLGGELSPLDEFTYRVFSGTLVSGPVRVALGGQRPLVAVDDFYPYTGGTVLQVSEASGVMENDLDPNLFLPVIGQSSVRLGMPPRHGTVILNQDGSFAYTPGPGQVGADVFTYELRSGPVWPVARVKLGNTAPVAAPDAYRVVDGAMLRVAAVEGVLANDGDADGDPRLTVQLATPPASGTLVLQPDGSFVFTPATVSPETVTFTYQVSDGRDLSVPATVTLRVVERLQIVSVDPPAHSFSETGGEVRVVFSRDIDIPSLDRRLGIFGSQTGSRAFTSSVNGRQLTLVLAEPPLAGELISVSLAAGIRGGASAELGQGYAWQYHARATRGGSSFVRTQAGNTPSLDSERVAVADFDGDGLPDAVTWNRDAFATIYRNNGNRTFTERTESLGLLYPGYSATGFPPVVGDLNRDGFPDLVLNGEIDSTVVQGWRDPVVRVGLNDGTGRFSVTRNLPEPYGTPALVLEGDFDADGDLDLFGAGAGNRAWVWLNDGQANFTPHPEGAVSIQSYQKGTVGDFNNDGALDVYLTGLRGDQLLLNNGRGGFTRVTSGLSAVFSTQAGVGDFDGNGGLDVLVGASILRPWLNDGAGSFRAGAFELPQSPSRDVVVADLNGDGRPDLWQVNDQDSAGQNRGDRVWFNDGNARFRRFGTDQGDSRGASAAAADFDRDGDLDVFVANDGSSPTSGNEVYFNQSAPVALDDAYAANGVLPVTVAAPGVLANDLAGDGGNSVVARVTGPARGSLVLQPDGSFVYTPGSGFAGTDVFTYRLTDSQATSSVARVKIGNSAPVAGADGPYLVAADSSRAVPAAAGLLANDADAEGDGLAAVLVTPPQHGTVALRAEGSFSYTPAPGYTGVDGFTYRATDGGLSSPPTTVSLEVRTELRWLATRPAAGTFAARTTDLTLEFSHPIQPAGLPSHLRVLGSQTGGHSYRATVQGTTVTLDPDLDFAAGETVSVVVDTGLTGAAGELLPRASRVEFRIEAPAGSGVFQVAQQIDTPNRIIDSLAVGDLDGDGDLDLFVPSSGFLAPADTRAWFNQGDGRMVEGSQSLGADGLTRPRLADLDGDGDLDAVTVVLTATNGLAIFLNDGSGGFTRSPQHLTDTNLISVVVADFTGDLRPDLVGFDGRGVWLWENDGAAGFVPRSGAFQNVSFANRSFSALEAADIDGDGTMDLVVRQRFSNQPTLLWRNDGTGSFNESSHMPGTGGIALAVGDVNGDGAPDLIQPATGTQAFVWLNDGSGQFAATQQTRPFQSIASATLAEVDGDGFPDLVVVQSELVGSVSVNRSVLLLNDGQGTFRAVAEPFGGATTLQRVTAGDVNGDGALDLLLGGGFSQVNYVLTNSPALPRPVGIRQLTLTDLQTGRPFADVSLRLPPASQVSVSVLPLDPDLGTFLSSSIAPGFVPADGGYALANVTAAEAEAALRALIHLPARHRVPVGQEETARFTLVIRAGSQSRTNTQTSVTTQAVNVPPVAVADGGTGFVTTAGRTFVTASVLDNDSDSNPGDALRILETVTLDTLGTVTPEANGTFRYSPPTGLVLPVGTALTDSFLYVLEDSQGARASARVTITVEAANEPPTAPDATVDVPENSGPNVLDDVVLGRVSDPNPGDRVALVAVDVSGSLGSVTVAPDGSLVYNPDGTGPNLAPSAHRLDSFQYTVADRQGARASGRVTVRIVGRNDAPLAAPVQLAASENDPVLDVTAALLASTGDPDPQDTRVISRVFGSATTGGIAVVDGTVRYSPNGRFDALRPGQTAEDVFEYEVRDAAGATARSMARVRITGVNSAPVAESASVIIDASQSSTELTATLLARASDPDHSPGDLRVATVDATGTQGRVDLQGGRVRYTPPASVVIPRGEFLTDRFLFVVADAAGAMSSNAVMTVFVRGVNSPPSAVEDQVVVAENSGALDLTAVVLSNDVDPDAGQTETLGIGSVDSSGTRGEVLLSGGVLTYRPNGRFDALQPGQTAIDSFAYTIRDAYGETSTATVRVTVQGVNNPPQPALGGSPATVQYSDPLGAVSLTVTDVDSAGAGLLVSTLWRTNGGAFATGLPAGLSLSPGATGLNQRAWSLSGTPQVPPGSYQVRFQVRDDLGGAATLDLPLTIVPEDARVVYTGSYFASTASATDGTATVGLSATVQDISAVPGDSNWDGTPGDIRNARVTFINRDTGSVIAENLPISLVSTADPRVGTTTFLWRLNIGLEDSISFNIGVRVTRHYSRDTSLDDVIVTVSKPLGNAFVTGGGFLTLTRSAGAYAGDVGSRMNFGFDAKFKKDGLDGELDLKLVRGRTTYRVESTALTSLVISQNQAVFAGRAEVSWSGSANENRGIDRGATFEVRLLDNGNPGSADRLAVTVWSSTGGLLFSSDWDGVRTADKTLNGGNLRVQSGGKAALAGLSDRATLSLGQTVPVSLLPSPALRGGEPAASLLALSFGSEAGRSYRIEGSSDLTTWHAVWDVSGLPDQTVVYLEPGLAEGLGFFRVRPLEAGGGKATPESVGAAE